ncbi:hypothetical protein [Ectopseudomonas hydrolytica]|uniref:hypothetical protein n=1 Tax=Ectopseudomonas hydrolytica TaxID=2493633 RepID=UPI003C2F0352
MGGSWLANNEILLAIYAEAMPPCFPQRLAAVLAAGSVHSSSIAAIRHLLCLVEIACQRSFAKADDALAVSQPAIARALRR